MSNRAARRVIAGIMVLGLLCSCGKRTASPAATAAAETAAPAATEAPTAEPAAEPTETSTEREGALLEIAYPDGVHADVDFSEMEWYLYDMGPFREKADLLASATDEREAEEAYQWLLTEYSRISTLDELAWIRFYVSGSEEDSDVCQANDEILTSAGDIFYNAVSTALAGTASRSFSEYVGEDVSEALSDYERMTDWETSLHARETELELEYNEFLSDDSMHEGTFVRKAGEILMELVSVRNELAKTAGYDSFAEYAYEVYYGRDYTPEDAAQLCEQIKPYARRYFENCYYCTAFSQDPLPGGTSAEQLLEMLRDHAGQISPDAAEALQYMEDHHLYVIDSADVISDMGFTTILKLYNAPFLYNSLSGGYYDVSAMFHEFGHYYDAYLNRPQNELTDAGSYDIFEIHSTALETLSCAWYDEIFGGKAEEARIYCLDGLMYNVVSGCIFDEFQRTLYENPETDPAKVSDVYRTICADYGMEMDYFGAEYWWAQVSHTFDSPFYYISYAASALASLQIWAISLRDYGEAMALYNRIVKLGAYDLGYFELLGEAGLARFNDDLDACVQEAYLALEEMCLRYDSGGLAYAA